MSGQTFDLEGRLIGTYRGNGVYDQTPIPEIKEMPAAESGARREKLNYASYDLIPFQELTDAYARVAEFGAKKYDAWNWSKGLPRVQLLGSLLRHTFAYLRGEERDRETQLLHTDHILWNAVTLCHNVHWNLSDGRRAEPEREYKNAKPVPDGKPSDSAESVVRPQGELRSNRAAIEEWVYSEDPTHGLRP